MINFRPQEESIAIIRRHWINIVGPIVISVILAIIPIVVPIHTYLGMLTSSEFALPLFTFLTICYWMIIIAFFLVAWVDYYFDTWIITTERVLDINQVTLFHRQISEFSVGRIQNVTVAIPSLIATLLHFGNVDVETAGEKSFSISAVPHPEKIKELLVRQSQIYQASPFGHQD